MNTTIKTYATFLISLALSLSFLLSCSETPIGPGKTNPKPVRGSGWQSINPYPTAESFYDVDFVDSYVGWAVGENGIVFHTADGGKSWNRQARELDGVLNSVQFTSRDNGWAMRTRYIDSAGVTIIRTQDGGESWETLILPNIDFEILSFQLTADRVGYVAGTRGVILRTEDGGDTWKLLNQADSVIVSSLSFVDSKTGWAATSKVGFGDGYLGLTIVYTPTVLKTNDGGDSWVRINLPDDSLKLTQIYFLDDQRGWLSGYYNFLDQSIFFDFSTQDGGEHWTPLRGGQWRSQRMSFGNIQFLDEDRGWAADYNLSRTHDGGDTWDKIMPERIAGIHALDFIDHQEGWAVGSRGRILHTIDGGGEWREQSSSSRRPGRIVKFFDDSSGIGLDKLSLMHTSDAGKHWTSKPIDLENGIIGGAFFLDESNGWIFGSATKNDRNRGAIILKTIDGGASWNIQYHWDVTDYFTDSHVYDNLYGGAFLGDLFGWAVGANGALVRTSDGGLNWTVKTISDQTLFAVTFISPNEGWAAGNRGTVLHTQDGGESWTKQVTNTSSTLMDIEFTSATDGIAVGSSAVILKTSDGGANWRIVQTPIDPHYDLKDMEFADALNGWTCGAGIIYGTTNGGETWIKQFSNFQSAFNSLSFLDKNTGWVGGGALLHTTSGGW